LKAAAGENQFSSQRELDRVEEHEDDGDERHRSLCNLKSDPPSRDAESPALAWLGR
jgi:hypothetical protein